VRRIQHLLKGKVGIDAGGDASCVYHFTAFESDTGDLTVSDEDLFDRLIEPNLNPLGLRRCSNRIG
jgi:hypothetical protein